MGSAADGTWGGDSQVASERPAGRGTPRDFASDGFVFPSEVGGNVICQEGNSMAMRQVGRGAGERFQGPGEGTGHRQARV